MRFWSYPERDTCLCDQCATSYDEWCEQGYDADLWWWTA